MFAALDGGWRVLCGQRPHVDYYSPYGALVPLLVGLGIRLTHGTAAGIGVASAIAGLTCSLMGYSIARRRLQVLSAAFCALYIFILTATPVPIGEFAANQFSNAMYYTRWSFGLLSVLLLETLAPEESNRRDGVSTGIACALLFFVKLNMFVLGIGLIVPSLLLYYKRERIASIFAGTAIVALTMMLYLRFHLLSIWHDYYIIIKAKSEAVSLDLMVDIARQNLLTLALVMLLATMLAVLEKHSRVRTYLPLMALTVFLADVLALATNWQRSETPLSTVFALFCIFRLELFQANAAPFKRQVLQLATVTACVVVAGSLMRNIDAYRLSVEVALQNQIEPPARFSTPSLKNYRVYGGPDRDGRPIDGRFLVAKVNDGLALLTQRSNTKESVAVVDYVNPFSFGLKHPPNPGGVSYLAYQNDFNDLYKPAPENVLGTADIVMVPKYPNSEAHDYEAILRNYGAYLKANFVPVAESGQWVMWRKKR